MTSFELADFLKIKESYLRSQWLYIVNSRRKEGITLVKVGRGAAAQYGVKLPGDVEIRWNLTSQEN